MPRRGRPPRLCDRNAARTGEPVNPHLSVHDPADIQVPQQAFAACTHCPGHKFSNSSCTIWITTSAASSQYSPWSRVNAQGSSCSNVISSALSHAASSTAAAAGRLRTRGAPAAAAGREPSQLPSLRPPPGANTLYPFKTPFDFFFLGLFLWARMGLVQPDLYPDGGPGGNRGLDGALDAPSVSPRLTLRCAPRKA